MKTIIGNWKMNLGIRESVALSRGVLRALRGKDIVPDVVICPPFTALSEVQKAVSKSKLGLGAQNCGMERSGAYTGEVSIPMLKDVSCSHVILGHSERRTLLNEDSVLIRKKFRLALGEKMVPVLCVGESKDEREAGRAVEFVENQLTEILSKMEIGRSAKFFVAYEPIWAIGTGDAATIADVVEMHKVVRAKVSDLTGLAEEDISILYGGSANDTNAYDFLRESEVDGLLVGGASIKLNQFTQIIQAASEVLTAQA